MSTILVNQRININVTTWSLLSNYLPQRLPCCTGSFQSKSSSSASNRKCCASSQVEHRLPVVAGHLLPLRPLPVLLGDGDQDHAHHEHHQPDGQQARAQDVGDLLAVAGEVQAADDDAARQEAAPGGHEVDGEPVDLAPLFRGLLGPEGLAAGQAEHGALRAAGRRQLVPGLGEGALSQGDVLWAARHGLLGDSVGGGISL